MTAAATQTAEIRLYRLPQVLDITGFTYSALYSRVAAGLFPRAIKIGPKRSAWPSNEIQSIVQAHVAGQSEKEIAALVQALHAARSAHENQLTPAVA